jgi:hypothetical protein
MKLAFAANDPVITVAGYARSSIAAHAKSATILSTGRDPRTGLFKVKLRPITHAATEATLILDVR